MDATNTMRATTLVYSNLEKYKLLLNRGLVEELQSRIDQAWKDLEGNNDIWNIPGPCPIEDDEEWSTFYDSLNIRMDFVFENLNEELYRKFGVTCTFYSRGQNGETLYPSELAWSNHEYETVDIGSMIEELEQYQDIDEFINDVEYVLIHYSNIDTVKTDFEYKADDAWEELKDNVRILRILRFIDKYLRAELEYTWEWWKEEKEYLAETEETV